MLETGVMSPLESAPPECKFDAALLSSKYAARELSPVDVVKAAVNRAHEIQGQFNAFTAIEDSTAVAAARDSESRWMRGAPLSKVDGIPTTLKDMVWVQGRKMGAGSLTSTGTPLHEDAPSVARLRAAGACFIGSTTTPEFGWKALTDSPATGITRNPWNPALTPGGSSGGAAVAAACGAGALHLGTDGGGSIRIPSAFCGVVGLKPSFGRVPAYPISAFGTLAHVGPMTRTVSDSLLMFSVMSGRDIRDWFQAPSVLPHDGQDPVSLRDLKIGYWREPPCGETDSEIQDAIDSVASELDQAGAAVKEISLPMADQLLSMFHTLWFSGASSRAHDLSESQLKLLDPGFRQIVEEGRNMSATELVRATTARAAFGIEMDRLLESYDVIISPAVTVLPFQAGVEVPAEQSMTRWTEWAGFSFPLNLSQQPAIVVPCAKSRSGLPIAIQIAGPRGCDHKVLAAAHEFEKLFTDRVH